MAMSFGFMEILIVLLLSGGSSGDIASMLPTETYLKHRQIATDVDSLMTWVVKEPSNPKTQLAQLVAMRRLGEQREAFAKAEKAAEYRQTLARIAEGKLAADKTGFASAQAAKTLADLDGKKLALPKLPDNIAEQAWTYFPKAAVMAGYVVVRNDTAGDGEAKVVEAAMKAMTDRERGQLFDAVETVGNIRIDRIAFAISEEDGTPTYVRISGKANPEWFLKEAFKSKEKTKFSVREDLEATLIDDFGTSIAIVGDSDVLILNRSSGKGEKGDISEKLIKQALRNAGKDNPATTTLKGELKNIPKNAIAAVVGGFPDSAKKSMGDKAPDSLRAFATRSPQGVSIEGQLTMADPNGAKFVAESASAMRKQALDGVAQLQGIQMPGMNIAAITATLQSVQIQGNGNQVSGQVLIHPDVFSSAPLMFFGRQQALQPQPPPR